MPIPLTWIRVSAVVPLVVLLAVGPASASEPDAPIPAPDASDASAEPGDASPRKRGFLFPPFKRRAVPPSVDASDPVPGKSPSSKPAGPDPNAEAALPPSTAQPGAPQSPSEGIWSWVDRMEGEIPTQEQVAAIQEIEEEHDAERSIVDELSSSDPPTAFYDDPARALSAAQPKVERIESSEFDIPVEVNASVQKWIQYFTGSGRQYYERWLSRAPRYQPMMRAKLKEAGLPEDLVYLSMIESGYNPHAYSHSDAAGLWQFIPSTGKAYDLRIDWWVDDRRDPERSLTAAIAFLGELHEMFGDWRLAWAAYNGGPGRVRRAIERTGSKDFWTLASGSELHPETQNYVPKIMAAAIIGHDPARYGFTNVVPQEALQYDVAHVDGSVEFEVLAKCAGSSIDDIKALNPALRRHATPPEGYDVRLPKGSRARFVAALDDIPKDERVTVVHHTVRRGETLSIIAGRYGTTVDDLSRANQLKNINRIVVGMNLVIPRGGVELESRPPKEPPATSGEAGVVLASMMAPELPRGSSAAPPPAQASDAKLSPSKPPAKATPKKPVFHVVERGETLSSIATAHGTSVAAIQSKNGLRGSTILVGQRLELPEGSEGGTASAAPAAPKVHVVARGETLSKIATRYGVDAEKLKEWNRIDDASHIEVGQRMTVNGPNPAAIRWAEYTVKQGDTLSKIATRHAVSVEDLRGWNDLKGSVIQPGQKLKIQQ